MRLVTALALLVTLAGCGGNDQPELPSPASVEWSNYAPEVKGRADTARQQQDCSTLQEMFDNADANNDAQQSRTGENNANLMGYLDDSMRYAGCYE